jgi:predicted XRE-type DNA-binding protein
MPKIAVRHGSGDVFADIGFSRTEAAELAAKNALIDAIAETIAQRKLTQLAAAKICAIPRSSRGIQPTLSKVLRGRMESVTIDRLAAWLAALGRTVEIRVRPYDARARKGHLVAVT